ncbi:MAG: glycosyltransferase [Candidatus Paceibacterota bacterium]
MKTLSIIIPSFNEQATIRELLSRVFAVSIPGWQIEVVVVDDCSTDGTRDILAGLKDKASIILRTTNGGKGSAVKDGLAAAKGDFILIQDADLEYHPNQIPHLVAAITGDDSVVYGSRNITGHTRKGFIISRLGVWIITKMVNILYGVNLTDIWTCYKLFPGKLKGLFGPGRFDSEVIFTLRAIRAGCDIREVPITYAPRDAAHGKKIRYRDGFQTIALILKEWFGSLGRVQKRIYFIACLACTAALVAASVMVYHSQIDPMSDAPSYIQAISILEHGQAPTHFVPNRILTATGGLWTIAGLSKIFGSYDNGWLIMNVIFYVISTLLFYELIKRIHGSDKVATLSALFLAGNYAMVTFGLSYFMDIGGWVFYIASALGVLCYARSGRQGYLWLASLAVGIGGLFKEYALLGACLIGLYLIYECFPSVTIFLKKIWRPVLIMIIPTLILHLAVYRIYDYTYFDWLSFAQGYYHYSSRVVEYVKVMGSLTNLLAILVIAGAYYLWRHPSRNIKAFTLCFLLSAAPMLLWPAITQRIAFVMVPALVVIASFFFKRFERYWYLFVPILIIYIIASFFMDSLILNFVNLPF